MKKMTKIRVTKEFSFEMAHALKGYDGSCLYVHGHSYRFFVTVKGTPGTDEIDPKLGMVMDFKQLKAIVGRKIIDRFDHALVVYEKDPRAAGYTEEKLVVTPFQPTCENLIAFFAELIQEELPATVELHHLKLHETATSFAEWYAEDNR